MMDWSERRSDRDDSPDPVRVWEGDSGHVLDAARESETLVAADGRWVTKVHCPGGGTGVSVCGRGGKWKDRNHFSGLRHLSRTQD